MRRLFLSAVSLFSLFFSAHAQWLNNISSFTTRNGVSNNTITSLQKDSAGFLWIGTHEGLNRYDGTEFINVLSNAKNNLPSNNVTRLCFIRKDLLAVATADGLCLLNTATLAGKVIPVPYLQKFSANGFYVEDLLYKMTTHQLWVATWHGLFVFDEEGKLQQRFLTTEADMRNGRFAGSLFTDAEENVFFFSQQMNGFYYPDFAHHSLVPIENRFPALSYNHLLKTGFVLRNAKSTGREMTCVFSKSTGTGNEECLTYYNGATGRGFIHPLAIPFPYEKRLSDAFPLSDSVFLVNSYFGEPLLYNTATHQLRRAAGYPLWFSSWPDGLRAFLFRDGPDLWIGTPKGLLQSSLRTAHFKTAPALTAEVQAHQSLVSFNYGLYNNGTLWVACMGAGLFGLDTLHNKVRSVVVGNPASPFRKKMISTGVMPAGSSLWLFSGYGPAQVDLRAAGLRTVQGVNKDSAFDDAARLPFKDKEGNIWCTLPDGLARYNVATATFTNYKTRYAGGTFPLLRPGPKTEDNRGNLWMTRGDTLVKFNPRTEKFTTSLLVKKGKSVRVVTSLASDGGDVLYLAVDGAFGIYHITTDSLALFTKQTGIVSTAINDLVSDNDGNAWLATEGGLVFYNRQTAKFSSFTKADGLPDDEVVGVNFADGQKRILFLGFAKTYCLFEPAGLLQQKAVPQNIITRAEADGEALPTTGAASLSYSQNNLVFTYTGINYNQGGQNSYAVMLEGFDREWKYPGAERKVTYINLPPAAYVFKVKSANHQGEWNEQAATFSFEIRPPFWQRWWFRLLMAAVLGLLAYRFIKNREAALQAENNRKLQMSELRMQALRAQMNPHFIFNSLNSIQNYILASNTMDAAAYLSKFAKLMRRILDQSKHNFLPLGEVLETLKMYVEIEAFRFSNEFIYSFDIADDDDLLDAPVPPMLLQPFVENAILHGLMPKSGEKKLLVRCAVVGKHIEIIIDDNGIGRRAPKEKAGHDSQGEKLTGGMLESLRQMQHRSASVEMIDKQADGAAAGTTVKIFLSINS